MSTKKEQDIQSKRNVGENQDNPTFEHVYMTLFRRMACEELNTVYPAVIESYDYKTQKADVSLMVKRTYKDGADLKYPVVSDVPVVMPRTQTSMIKLPIKKGDTVLVLFSKSSLDEWLLGAKESTVSVQSQFKMSDAVAICGLFPFGEGAQAEDEDSLEIMNAGQKIIIRSDGDIELGSGTLKSLATSSFVTDVNTAITALGGTIPNTGNHTTSKTKAQ